MDSCGVCGKSGCLHHFMTCDTCNGSFCKVGDGQRATADTANTASNGSSSSSSSSSSPSSSPSPIIRAVEAADIKALDEMHPGPKAGCRRIITCQKCNAKNCVNCESFRIAHCHKCEKRICKACQGAGQCQLCKKFKCVDCNLVAFCSFCTLTSCQSCCKTKYCDDCKLHYCTSNRCETVHSACHDVKTLNDPSSSDDDDDNDHDHGNDRSTPTTNSLSEKPVIGHVVI